MPELSEVKIMSDFINSAAKEEGFFDTIVKSEVSKINTELDPFGGAVFTVSSKSRGKELMLQLEMVGGDIKGAVVKNLLCTMGMSGNWVYIRKNAPQLEKAFKHSHLRLQSTRGNWLLLHDVRRFAKWKWVDTWGANRGPCPLTEYNQFAENLKTNWHKSKDFEKPLCELLMNQKWFNGVGAYIRSELLYITNFNPFIQANKLTLEDINLLIKTLHILFRETYQLNGGHDKQWYSQNTLNVKNFNSWFKCYGNKNMIKIVDKKGRNLWFDKSWEKQSIDYLN